MFWWFALFVFAMLLHYDARRVKEARINAENGARYEKEQEKIEARRTLERKRQSDEWRAADLREAERDPAYFVFTRPNGRAYFEELTGHTFNG